MAAAAVEVPSALLALATGDKILVTVESALPDILVVSFVHGAKCFQGALLDANKSGLPCGVQPPEPVPGPDGDKLSTIAARFSYFQERKTASSASAAAVLTKVDLRRSINPPARYKNARPTVRLRPRQVLCSKCRSICNENSENVDVSKKRKHEEMQQQPQQQFVAASTRRSDRRCGQQPQKAQRTLLTEYQTENSSSGQATKTSSPDSSKLGASLIPKLSRLQPNEISNAMQGSSQFSDKVKVATSAQPSHWSVREESEASLRSVLRPAEERIESTDCDSNPSMAYCATPRRLSSSSVESAKVPEEEEKKTFAAADSTMRLRTGRVPRKKRSVGSMEDLWDESVFEDPTRTARTTPVIKISFGAQGEGTVLKIPAKLQDPEYEQETDDPDDTQQERDPLELPRSFGDDYEYHEEGQEEDGQEQVDPQKQGVKDASAKAAKRALKKAKKEARRKMLGGVSPARSPCNGSPRYNPTYDPLSYHRRKHKVKHKKKHKEGRKHKSQQQQQEQPAAQLEQSCLDSAEQHQQNWNVLPGGESYRAIKEQCLKQKLSISLKRLNTNAYARCDYPVSNASSGCKSSGGSSDELSEHEPEVETAPDFPPQSHPLVMRLAATPVAHCLTANGRRMDVGDVVWGKIHGFPWWPGKVLSITVSCKEDGTSSGPQAHVAWYGSSTSSLMSCDQLSPFLETFKTRYNKKKRGPYKEAIRQAQNEARSQITPNSTNSVLNVCGSPREVNVLS